MHHLQGAMSGACRSYAQESSAEAVCSVGLDGMARSLYSHASMDRSQPFRPPQRARDSTFFNWWQLKFFLSVASNIQRQANRKGSTSRGHCPFVNGPDISMLFELSWGSKLTMTPGKPQSLEAFDLRLLSPEKWCLRHEYALLWLWQWLFHG